MDESHVQHPVSLVEDHHTDGPQLQGAPVQVVDDPAGGAYDYVDASPELVYLAVDTLSAVDGADPDPGVPADPRDVAGYLYCQLTGGRQHEPLDSFIAEIDAFHHWDAESRRLACPRLGLADHVPAFEEGHD